MNQLVDEEFVLPGGPLGNGDEVLPVVSASPAAS